MKFNDEIEWREFDSDIWPLAYKSEEGHLAYIEDQYRGKHPYNQTDWDDWEEERYSLEIEELYTPQGESKTIHESDSWAEVEARLEAIVEDGE